MTRLTGVTVSETTRISVAGFCAIAVAFGIARNGYGLFLPAFRDEFELSVELSGAIGSGLQAGYLSALLIVGALVARVGPRLPVVIGGLSAVVGLVIVAFSQSAGALATGVIVAGTSAGWCWAPYNDATDRAVEPSLRGRVLSIISTGTTFGIVIAGIATLAAGSSWRSVWLLLAVAALASTVLNARTLSGGAHGLHTKHRSGDSILSLGLRWFVSVESVPLFVAALGFGLVTAFYWAFAVDIVSRSGVFGPSAGPVFYIILGIAGFTGLLTGDAVNRFGLRAVLVGIMVSLGVAACLLGIAPGAWLAVGASAGLYGADVMLGSALLSVWSSMVFPMQPSTGFSATLVLFGAGSVMGPALLGVFAGSFGLAASFIVAAVLSLITALVRPALS